LGRTRIWILVDFSRCSGCRLCEVVCPLKNEETIWFEASEIRIFEVVPGATILHSCVQCSDNHVLKVALQIRSQWTRSGAVIVGEEAYMKISYIRYEKYKGALSDALDYELVAYLRTNLGIFDPEGVICMPYSVDESGLDVINVAIFSVFS